MILNTVLLLELYPSQRKASKLGANLLVAETTNISTDTTQNSAPLSMKSVKGSVLPIELDGDLDHHQVVT